MCQGWIRRCLPGRMWGALLGVVVVIGLPQSGAWSSPRVGEAAVAGVVGPTNPHVRYDRWSLSVDGRRIIINSGEVDYFRMPDPAEWPDMLARVKASGLNTIETLVPWNYHEPAPGRFRFKGSFDVERYLADARDAGLYVIVRPGPNLTGGIDGAGFPSWLMGRPGYLRTNDPAYATQWHRWYAHIIPRLARWQIGGPNHGTVILLTIENEYFGLGPGPLQYMEDLYRTARQYGVTVPIVDNDASNIPQVPVNRVSDLYGFDNYPLPCSIPCLPSVEGTPWNTQTFNSNQTLASRVHLDQFESQFRADGITGTPLYASEISGGLTPGIEGYGRYSAQQLYRLLEGYLTVQQLSIVGQGLTMFNQWIGAGATTWGYSVSSGFATSYDWLSPVREWLGLGERFYEQRRVAGEIAATQASLAATVLSGGAVTASNPQGLYRVRRSLVDGSLHIILRNAGNRTDLAPRLHIGSVTTPPVPLPRRSARYLIAHISLAGWRIGWTTAEVMMARPDTLVLFGDPGRRYAATVDGRRIDFVPGWPRLLPFGPGRAVLVLDRHDAGRAWFSQGRVLVGPAVVTPRGMETDRPTMLTIVARGRATSWMLAGPPRSLRTPALVSWRFRAEGPDLTDWVRASKQTTTNNQVQPLTRPVLYADEYNMATGFVWYRGLFTGSARGMCIEGRHVYHVWLNGHSLGTISSTREITGPVSGSNSYGQGPPVHQQVYLHFSPADLRRGRNVISVLTDDYGHNMDTKSLSWAKTPRGLISAKLDRGSGAGCGFFISGAPTTSGNVPTQLPQPKAVDGGITWWLHGGRLDGYPNVSGLAGEQRGWYRTRFDDRTWQRVALPDARRLGDGKVGWYRTSFSLTLPTCTQTGFSIEIPRSAGRVEVYLNGVHVARAGRDAATRYVLMDRLLHTDGRPNTLALAHWAIHGSAMPRPRLVVDDTFRTCAFGATAAGK